MSNNESNKPEAKTTKRSWVFWFVGGGAVSILSICSVLMLVIVLISGTLNAVLFWRLRQFELRFVAPAVTTASVEEAAANRLLVVVTATPIPTSISGLDNAPPTEPVNSAPPNTAATATLPPGQQLPTPTSLIIIATEPASSPNLVVETATPNSSNELQIATAAVPTDTELPTRVAVRPSVPAELQNGEFEDFQFRLRDGEPILWQDKYPEEVGRYWMAKVVSEVRERRTHLLSSPIFGNLAKDLYGGSGLNYSFTPQDNTNSQVIVSQYGYDVVLYQSVAAEPSKAYKFDGKIVSFYKGTDNPATPDKIFKRVGIDPTGGQDYDSDQIVWSERVSTDHEWISVEVSAVAQAEVITVFIRIENEEENVGTTELNIVHLDRFRLE